MGHLRDTINEVALELSKLSNCQTEGNNGIYPALRVARGNALAALSTKRGFGAAPSSGGGGVELADEEKHDEQARN
jgi:hypothetical protein